MKTSPVIQKHSFGLQTLVTQCWFSTSTALPHTVLAAFPVSVLSSNTVLVLLSSVSGVRLSPASPELILDHDHSSPSSGRLPSDALISSPDDTRADSGLVSQTIPKAQVSAGLSEGSLRVEM